MSTIASIGRTAPDLQLQSWVQGDPTNISDHAGKVILVEVFQVNCPGCFVHALPEVIRLHSMFEQDDFTVLGVATAFEDFDKNTLHNLNLLIETGEMIGEPLKQLRDIDFLNDNKLDYNLPFPVAMDKLVENKEAVSEKRIISFIEKQIPDYNAWNEEKKQSIFKKARDYLKSKTHDALTFECYQLQGTPSSILIDKQGILRDVSFGGANHLEPIIKNLLLK